MHTFICTCIHMYPHMCTTHACMHSYRHTPTHACTHTQIHSYTCNTLIHPYTCTVIHPFTHTLIHACTHTHIHTFMHTQTNARAYIPYIQDMYNFIMFLSLLWCVYLVVYVVETRKALYKFRHAIRHTHLEYQKSPDLCQITLLQ